MFSNQAAVQRTEDIHDVISTPECSGMKIVAEQTANYDRTQASEPDDQLAVEGHQVRRGRSPTTTRWRSARIQAMKSAGIDTKSAIVGGVDATQDALASMKAGDLKVTVFQDAAGQGKGAVDAALALAAGKPVEK